MKKINIALVGYEANIANRVGSNQYAYELIKAIYRFDKKNNYLVYLPSEPLPDMPPRRNNWHYRVVGPNRLWNFYALPLGLFRQQPKPEIVFNPGHYAPVYTSSKLVISIMDLGYLYYPKQFTLPIRTKLKLLTGFSIRRADHILAISEFTRNDIINTYRVKPDKVTATPLGFDRDKFYFPQSRRDIEAVKKKFGLKQNYLLFLGTFKPSKNIEGLLKAFKDFSKQKPDYQLVLAGRKGWLYQKVFKQVKDLELGNRVVFTGFVKDKEIAPLIAGAAVFVLVSFWEGFGIPVLEAMAVGTPVVVSRAASLPEVVAEAGILVDPNSTRDILKGINEAINKRQELSLRVIKQARQYSWEKCAQKTLAVLNNLAGK